jgi:glycosidase
LAGSILSAVKSSNVGAIRQEAQYAYDNLLNNEFGTFLTNHDQNRVYDELSGNDGKMKVAASIYLTLPGIPYIYYGEEIGLRGSKPDENIRTPMQWNSGAYAGFSTSSPWQSVNSNYPSYNVAAMLPDTNSLLSHYKKLIAIRNANEVMNTGTYQNVLTGDSSVYALTRQSSNQKVLVMINTSSRNISNLAISTSLTGLSDANYSLFDLMNNRKKNQCCCHLLLPMAFL